MGSRDPRVDAYIARSAEFARPVLAHLRTLVHRACPEVEETMKWSFPHFMYKGMFASMAAFKAHCAFGFWKGSLLAERHERLAAGGAEAMGHLGRIASREDLPPDRVLLGYLREAKALNDAGVKAAEKRPRTARAPLRLPADLGAALKANRKAMATWKTFRPSHRREYLEWVTEAKRPETRARRVAEAVGLLAEGKSRHWKYQRA